MIHRSWPKWHYRGSHNANLYVVESLPNTFLKGEKREKANCQKDWFISSFTFSTSVCDYGITTVALHHTLHH